MNRKNKSACKALKENLLKLNRKQLKFFYGILVHGWACRRAFISTLSFFNLRCELNEYCYEADEGFPDPYGDLKLFGAYCHAHPFYFIDRLELGLIADLFCEYFEDRIVFLQQ